MGIPSSLIILGIVLVALILIFTIGLTETLPLYIKTEFDSACSEFVDNFIVRGKYSSQDLTELLAGLDKMNIVITEVRAYLSNDENNYYSAGEVISWGETVTIIITGIYEYESMSGDGSTSDKAHTLRYKRTFKMVTRYSN